MPSLRALDEAREGVPLEDIGVLGEQAEEHADEEAFEAVAGVAGLFEFVVQIAEERDGLLVNLRLGLKKVLFLVADEGEVAELLRQLVQGEGRRQHRRAFAHAGRRHPLEVVVHLLAEIVEREVPEVRDQHPARQKLRIEVRQVFEGLKRRAVLCGGEIAPGGLHLHQQLARPQQIDAPLALFGPLYAVFMHRVDGATVAAKNIKELVEKTLRVGLLALRPLPTLGKRERTVAYLFARKGENGGGAGHRNQWVGDDRKRCKTKARRPASHPPASSRATCVAWVSVMPDTWSITRPSHHAKPFASCARMNSLLHASSR